VSPEPSASPEATSTEATSTPAPQTQAPGRLVGERAPRALAAAAGVGDVLITGFDDRYADGLFDVSTPSRDGLPDEKNDRLARLITSDGVERWASENAEGDYLFEDVPTGEAKAYFLHPNSVSQGVFFDATDATSADDIERLPNGSWSGIPAGIATVDVDEDGEELLVGFTGLRSVAVVECEGAPVSGATVELASAGTWYPATESPSAGGEGQYEALDVVHLPDELGLRITAPAGYAVAEVTAVGRNTFADPIPVEERPDGTYWIDTRDVSSYTANPAFEVELEKLPTGDLIVTGFYDNYADGLYDPSKTTAGGSADGPLSLAPSVKLADGTWRTATSGSQGGFVFDDLPVGEVEVHFFDPNSYPSVVFFDATDATSAEGITRLPTGSYHGSITGYATVSVDEDGEDLLVGMAAAKAAVAVKYPNGSAATGLSGIEFGSGGDWFVATEYAGLPGSYEAQNGTYGVSHVPDEIGLRIAAPEGYAIGEVTAIDSVSGAALDLTERKGAWWIETTDFAASFSRSDFTVTLEKLPTATVEVTYFGDVVLDGVFDPETDLPMEGGEVYLHDSAGEWWATTAMAGEFRFSGVAPGAATIYTQILDPSEPAQRAAEPELTLPEAGFAVWDATDITSYSETVRGDTQTVSFEGTFLDPETGEARPISVADELVGVIPAELEPVVGEGEPQAVFVGAASILQLAGAFDLSGADAADNVAIEFLANAESAQAIEIEDGTGALVAAEADGEIAVFGAAEYGIRATPAEGYEVVEVGAVSALTGEVLEVTDPSAGAAGALALFAAAASEYRVAPEQVGGPAGAVVWAVVVAPIIPTDPGATPALPGVDGPGFGLPSSGGQPAATGADRLPATGSDLQPWTWMLAAGLLIAAGIGTRVVARRRNS
jgi:hypothetical protein